MYKNESAAPRSKGSVLADVKYVVNVEGAVVQDRQYLMIIRGQAETHAGGMLSFVDGKVEAARHAENVLEEVGVQIGEMAYVQSSHFIANDGDLVIDVIFLCRYKSGESHIHNVGEVGAILWLDISEILQHLSSLPWLKQGIQRVEELRRQLNW